MTIISRAAQLEKLESKIEHLVNALATAPQVIRATQTHGQPSPPISTSRMSSDRGVVSTDDVLQSLCDEGHQCDSTSPPSPSLEATKSSAVTLNEAEVLLDRYVRLMSKGMPFVTFPRSVSAYEFFQSNPVLLRAITTVTLFHDLPRQQILVKDLIRDLSERIIVKSEKSLDLLQAILVFVCWYHPHVCIFAWPRNNLHANLHRLLGHSS